MSPTVRIVHSVLVVMTELTVFTAVICAY